MRSLKHHASVYPTVRKLLGTCPLCIRNESENIDNNKKKDSCKIYRTSKSSFTLRCKKCGLRSTITWKNIADALGRKVDTLAADESQEAFFNFFANSLEAILMHTDTSGVQRKKFDR